MKANSWFNVVCA